MFVDDLASVPVGFSMQKAYERGTIFRESVDLAVGGKIPESFFHRQDLGLNQKDSLGLDTPRGLQLTKILKGKYLPEKASSGAVFAEHDGNTFGGSSFDVDDDDTFPQPFGTGFPFSEKFQSPFRDERPSGHVNGVKSHQGDDETFFGQLDGNSVLEKKPHLFTSDPYVEGVLNSNPADGPKFRPPPSGYKPPVAPYKSFGDSAENYGQALMIKML